MKTKINLSVLILSIALLQGCANTTPLAVAERGTKVAFINFDAFLKFERENEAQLLAINPQIHATATKIRHKECKTCDQNGIRWFESVRRATEVYRLARTPENKANLDTALAVVQQVLTEIAGYFSDPQVAKLSPATAAYYKKG